jgi:hypothetical protein
MHAKIFYLWLAIPAVALAVHFGPGRAWLERDDAAALVREAEKQGEEGNWEEAAAKYAAALIALPAGPAEERQRLEVALGRALVMSGSMIEGQDRLEKTLAELTEAGQDLSPIAQSARYELATSSYYAAWLMRLEGATAEEWKAEAEVARQNFRLLAETSVSTVSEGSDASPFERSLEATIRLEQMDLSELLAKPLPKNCPNCKQGLCQKKRKQCASRCNSEGKKKGEKKEEQDARKDVKKTNNAGLYSGNRQGS